MKFFKKIFVSEEHQQKFAEKRKESRFPIAIEFPLIIEAHGALLEPTTISLHGLSFFSPKNFDSELLKINFILEQKELSLVAQVKHVTKKNKIHYGVEFNYRNDSQKKDYYQMILPIIVGNSLKEVNTENIEVIGKAGLRRVFKSNEDVTLNFYYIESGSASHPLFFEFIFENFLLSGSIQEKNIKVFNRKTNQMIFVTPIPLIRETRQFTEIEEMILLFRWTILNLSKHFEKDDIEYLHSFL